MEKNKYIYLVYELNDWSTNSRFTNLLILNLQ